MSIATIQVIDLSIKNLFNNFIDIISAKFEIEKEKLIEVLNLPPKVDENQKFCTYVATTGKNIGKVCGRKCKKEFCYSHQPEVLEKKKLERLAKKQSEGKEEKEKIIIEGDDIEDIINNIFLEWSEDENNKSITGTINRDILSGIVNKSIAVHNANDNEDFEKDGYPVTINIAKTKLKINYEDGNGLQKALITKKSCLSEQQVQTIYAYIYNLKN